MNSLKNRLARAANAVGLDQPPRVIFVTYDAPEPSPEVEAKLQEIDQQYPGVPLVILPCKASSVEQWSREVERDRPRREEAEREWHAMLRARYHERESQAHLHVVPDDEEKTHE